MIFSTAVDNSVSDDVWPIIAMVVFTAFSIWFKRRKELTEEPKSIPEREPVLEMAELENTERVRSEILKRIEEREKARIGETEKVVNPVPFVQKMVPVRVLLEEPVEHQSVFGSVQQKLHTAKGLRDAFKMSVVLERYSR
jgi:hypothetical protein